MKKMYEAPFAEKIDFQYKDHVVASGNCIESYNKDDLDEVYGCDHQVSTGWNKEH